jgi:L,D-transpeptidase YcbB
MKKATRKTTFLVPVLALFLPLSAPAAGRDDSEALLIELEYLREAGSTGESDIAALPLISEFYERRSFAPAWTDAKKRAELLSLIDASPADGLRPEDYHRDAVAAAVARLSSDAEVPPREQALDEIKMTDSLVRLAYHELFGKVNPVRLDPNWNFERALGFADPAGRLEAALGSPSLGAALEALAPRGWLYQQIKAALARYREIAAHGGWTTVPDGPTLRPGERDDRLAALGARLAVTGDLVGALDTTGETYAGELVEAVERFQERHGLDRDGVVGPATLRALNVPVEERILDLEISLERARWVTRGLDDTFVLVNIAAFRIYLVRNRQVAWESRVQVGTPYRRTPIFRDEITYLVFNPTWTVPYSIATRDILPQIRRDPGYLEARGFDVRNSSGAIVDPATIDWAKLSRSSFPYTLVQRPGPANALGRVKIMFPNSYAVYLHDTPSRDLFGRAERAFSSGCIRVENPFELAELLLAENGWDRQRIDRVVASGMLTDVVLANPVPVMLLYWTATVENDGKVHFYDDIYDRDAAVAQALAAPFRLEPPDR